MATNKELVQQAVAAIPLWRAFLDLRDAEQDAILAEMRNENPNESKPKKLIKSLTARFRSQPTTASRPNVPVNQTPLTPKAEVPLNLVAEEPVVEIPISEGVEKITAENDLLDKEVEVNLPTSSPTRTNSGGKNEVTPRVVPVTTKEPIQQVSEDNDNDDDDNDNEFKNLF